MLTLTRLDLTEARTLITAAKAKAEEIGVPMCIAVMDESCNLIAFERMDGAKVPSITIAIDKAFTAAGTRNPTKGLGEASQPGKPAWGVSSTIGGRMVVIAGGLPVASGGAVIGGIGVSGGSPDQDLEVAEAAVAAFVGG
ncbi:GlcG/HbpS family heme-binding protein [Marinovum sp.]|uniref:GlcG/HbpS family heme-binding protein n=1 Tax=Marinovum sp. TaxID=2024839 RepID=UPI003A934035